MVLALVVAVPATLSQEQNSRASITADYRQVTIVAHIKIQKAERVEQIGGYIIFRITGQILELFKGKFPADANFVYYMQVESGYNMDHYVGQKIVFLSFHNNDEATEYRALENSDREPTTKIVSILRGLKRSQHQATH